MFLLHKYLWLQANYCKETGKKQDIECYNHFDTRFIARILMFTVHIQNVKHGVMVLQDACNIIISNNMETKGIMRKPNTYNDYRIYYLN